MTQGAIADKTGLFKKLRIILKDAQQAYVFGSFSRGDEDGYSDLDLLVVKKTELDFFHRFQEFPELYELGLAVDLFVYTPEEFAEMRKEGNPLI